MCLVFLLDIRSESLFSFFLPFFLFFTSHPVSIELEDEKEPKKPSG